MSDASLLILIGVVILAAIWMKYHFHLKELERRLDATVKNISKLDSTDAARAIREMDIDGSTYRSRMIGYRPRSRLVSYIPPNTGSQYGLHFSTRL